MSETPQILTRPIIMPLYDSEILPMHNTPRQLVFGERGLGWTMRHAKATKTERDTNLTCGDCCSRLGQPFDCNGLAIKWSLDEACGLVLLVGATITLRIDRTALVVTPISRFTFRDQEAFVTWPKWLRAERGSSIATTIQWRRAPRLENDVRLQMEWRGIVHSCV